MHGKFSGQEVERALELLGGNSDDTFRSFVRGICGSDGSLDMAMFENALAMFNSAKRGFMENLESMQVPTEAPTGHAGVLGN